MLRQLPVELPKSFEDALGYPREGYMCAFTGGSVNLKWVAFYWEPCGDEAMYDDGFSSGDCNWHGFLEFVRHPNVKPWLSDSDLGSSDSDAKHWLLCNLETRELFVGEKAEVAAFLSDEVRKNAPAENMPEISQENFGELISNFMEKMKEVPVPSMAEIEEKMRRDYEAVEKMVAELSGNT